MIVQLIRVRFIESCAAFPTLEALKPNSPAWPLRPCAASFSTLCIHVTSESFPILPTDRASAVLLISYSTWSKDSNEPTEDDDADVSFFGVSRVLLNLNGDSLEALSVPRGVKGACFRCLILEIAQQFS